MFVAHTRQRVNWCSARGENLATPALQASAWLSVEPATYSALNTETDVRDVALYSSLFCLYSFPYFLSCLYSSLIRIYADMPNAVVERLTPIEKKGDAILDTPATALAVTRARKELNVSQKALAIEMKISQAYLCDLENGKRRWSLSQFNNAKDALGRLVG